MADDPSLLAPDQIASPAAQTELPTADDLWAQASALPTADELYAEAARKPTAIAPMMPMTGQFAAALYDRLFAQPGPLKRITDAASEGMHEGFGTEPLGTEAEKALKDFGLSGTAADQKLSLTRALNSVIVRPAAIALEAAIRGVMGAGYRGAQGAAYQTMREFGADKGTARDWVSIPDAFMGSPHPTGIPSRAAIAAREAEVLRKLGEAGASDAEYFGLKPRVGEATPSPGFAEWSKRMREEEGQGGEAAGDTGADANHPGPGPAAWDDATGDIKAVPDIHDTAREIAPDLIAQRDRLVQQRDTFARWLRELRERRREAIERESPYAQQASEVERQLAAMEDRLEGESGKRKAMLERRIEEMTERYMVLSEQHEAWVQDRLAADPQIARIRNEYQRADYRLRDMAPDITRVYREAQARMAENAPREEAATDPAGRSEEINENRQETAAVEPAGSGEEIGPLAPKEEAEGPPLDGLEHQENLDAIAESMALGKDLGYQVDGNGNVRVARHGVSGDADHVPVTLTAEEGAALREAETDLKGSKGDERADAKRRIQAVLKAAAQREIDKAAGHAEDAAKAGESAEPVPPGAPSTKTPPEMRQRIAADVAARLERAGQSPELAAANGAIVASYYAARAERMGGALGTAWGAYQKHAPDIRSGVRKIIAARAKEMAQREELGQSGDHARDATTVNAPEDINPNEKVRLPTVYRGVEGGTDAAGALRVFSGGDLGDGIYLTPWRALAESYGGAEGAGAVHAYGLTRDLEPNEVAYLFGGLGKDGNWDVTLVRGDGVELYRGPWDGGSGKPGSKLDAALGDVKAVVGTPDSVGVNQVAIRDGSLLGPELNRELGQDLAPETRQVIDSDLTVNSILAPETPALPPRSRSVGDIAKELMDRGAAALKKLGVRSGRIEGPSPKTDEIVSHAIASEIRAALGRIGRTASDWYTTKVQQAMAVAATMHPEIATDPHARFGFTASLAITSQGETVPSNVRLAEPAYAHFKATGRFPTDIDAKNQAAMNANFAKLNALLDSKEMGGPEGVREFMSHQFTVKELNDMGFDVGGENKGTKVYGSSILGPKIGQGFYQNLNGNFHPVTMDLWFMRAWGRLTGTLVGLSDEAVAKQRARLEVALEAEGQWVPKTGPALQRRAEAVIRAHEQDFKKNRKSYDSGEKSKSELTYAAERYLKGREGINEQPTSGNQRIWMRDRVERAREILAEEGIEVTNADLQAIWWYPEKDLYGKLGGRDSEGINVDYASAISDLARSKGVSDEAIASAMGSVEHRPGSAAGADVAGGDRGGGGQGGALHEGDEGPHGPPDQRELGQIPPDVARKLPYETRLPSDPKFRQAIENTDGATLLDDGLLIDLERFQKPEQAGERSVRTGVFYLPAGDKRGASYARGGTGGFWYGGEQRLRGETLVRAPLMVKGATGGRAPEAAYEAVKGKGAVKALDRELGDSPVTAYGLTPELREEALAKFLEEHGSDPTLAWEILHNSKKGNQLRYAIRENVMAHAVREAGYDSIVGYSEGRGKNNGKPFISEVFDLREDRYPTAEGDYSVHPDFSENLDQIRRGKIRLGEGATPLAGRPGTRGVITLLGKADASTFVHETGHLMLEDLLTDAQHEKAPAQLRDDADAVLKWLGVDKAADVAERHHEKFARGFEAYMREGRAPSQALARVFEQFKSWLLDIYRTALDLKAPINDDIRGVFDRMLAHEPEHVVEAAERDPGRSFADIHEADAEHTAPEEAGRAADQIEDEIHDIARGRAPEVADELGRADEAGEGAAPAAEGGGDEPAGRDAGGDDGAAGQPAAVGGGAGSAAAEGPWSRRGDAPAGPSQPFTDPAPQLIDRAGNIRLDNLGTTEDVNTVIRMAAEEAGGHMEARRGRISDAEAIDLADALGMGLDKINMRKVGEAWNAEQIIAARKLLIRSAMAVRDLMVKASTGDTQAIMAYIQAKTRHLMIQETVAGITAEAGRALRALRALEGMKEAEQINDFLKKNAGTDLFQMQEEARRGASLETPGELSQFIHNTRRAKISDWGMEAWINALLSGPVTFGVNMVGNGLIVVNHLAETAIAAGYGVLHGGEKVHIGELKHELAGILFGAMDGAKAAVNTYWHEDSMAHGPHTVEQRKFQAIPSYNTGLRVFGEDVKIGGRQIRIPSRLLAASDDLFKAISYRVSINSQAYRTATAEGLTGQAFAARMSALRMNPSEAMGEVARKFAEKQTFTNPLGTFGTRVQMLANTTPAMKVVLPFVRTPTNLFKYAGEISPLGFAAREAQADLSGANGSAARDLRMARITIGSALAITATLKALDGTITGGGPSDPEKKALWRQEGWNQPYSVKIGNGSYYSYANLDPFATVLGITADLVEAVHAGMHGEEHEKVASMIGAAFSQNVMGKVSLRGVSDLMKAVTDPDRYGERYVRQMAGTLVPSFLGQEAAIEDPVLRDARSILDVWKSRIPGLRETLHPQRDIWGEEIVREGALGPDRLSRIYISTIKNDPVNKQLIDAQLGAAQARPRDPRREADRPAV
jgi:hypothetical protein